MRPCFAVEDFALIGHLQIVNPQDPAYNMLQSCVPWKHRSRKQGAIELIDLLLVGGLVAINLAFSQKYWE